MSSVETWRSPVLFIHGDDDRNVPFRETVDLAQKLRRRGVEVEVLSFPDEVHGFLLHEELASRVPGSQRVLRPEAQRPRCVRVSLRRRTGPRWGRRKRKPQLPGWPTALVVAIVLSAIVPAPRLVDGVTGATIPFATLEQPGAYLVAAPLFGPVG